MLPNTFSVPLAQTDEVVTALQVRVEVRWAHRIDVDGDATQLGVLSLKLCLPLPD